jgi:hypothetical protein
MNGWLRKLRAAGVMALVFGVVWGTTIQLVVIAMRFANFGFTRLGGSELWLSIYPMLIAIGFAHGMLFSLLLGAAGRDRTVDTFPRWLGALIGGMVAAAGAVLLGIPAGGGGGWPLVGLISGVGAFSTAGLLTVARRGALPTVPQEPKQIGS